MINIKIKLTKHIAIKTFSISFSFFLIKTIIKNMIENGANINKRNKEGQTAVIITSCLDNKFLTMYLVEKGANIKAYDPQASDEFKKAIGDDYLSSIEFVENRYDALDNSDGLVLITEWKEFRMPNVDTLLHKMQGRLILDGRNILDSEELHQAGFEYHCIGKVSRP